MRPLYCCKFHTQPNPNVLVTHIYIIGAYGDSLKNYVWMILLSDHPIAEPTPLKLLK